ncbi:MAG: hypothetical protein HC821_03280, partial [Lewinella sp.]|nr:hypothetical protein [Lewinella sp.]
WAAAVLGFQAITPVFDGASEKDINEALGEAIAPTLIQECPAFMDLIRREAEAGNPALEGLFDAPLGGQGQHIYPDEHDEPDDNLSWKGVEWSDMGEHKSVPEIFGGPENKAFITEPMAYTNRANLPLAKVNGKILAVLSGPVNEISLQDQTGKIQRLLLTQPLTGEHKLKKGAMVILSYETKKSYHAGRQQWENAWIIRSIE